MKSVLLATGEENSLPPLTEHMPSPMLPIANRPVMVYAVELLVRYGIKDVFVNLHNSGEQIEKYLGSGQRWAIELTYRVQRDAWGTAGAIKRAGHSLSETFVVVPADAMLDFDLDKAYEFHKAHGGMATVIFSHGDDVKRPPCDALSVNADNQLMAVSEYSPEMEVLGEEQVWNTGAYIFEPEILNHIPVDTVYDCHGDLLPALLQKDISVYGFESTTFWNPLHSFVDYQHTQALLLHSLLHKESDKIQSRIRFPYIEGHQPDRGVWLGHNAHVHSSVHMTPPVYIGEEARIGRDVELGPNVVIGANAVVDSGATITQSTILKDTYVGKLVNISRKVVDKERLIDVQSGEHVRLTDRFLLAEVDPAVAKSVIWTLVEKVTALILLLLALPVLLCLLVLIPLFSGKSPWITVPRVGRRPKWDTGTSYRNSAPDTVRLLRLRTRYSEDAFVPLGRLIERWEWHRLPELWNVIWGDIGLVGVMPLSPESALRVQEDWQHRRYTYQAGFTGLWYVRRDTIHDFDELCVVDAYHAATRNWRTDFKYLLQTPAAWFRHAFFGQLAILATPSRTPAKVRADSHVENYAILQEASAELLDIGVKE